MAEFQVPNPTISLATENTLGNMPNIAPVNFYNPIPVKDYTTGIVNPPKDKTQEALEKIALNIFDNQMKEINKNHGLTNPLTNAKQVPFEQTKRYQDSKLGYSDSANLEYIYGENQGFLGAVGNSLIQASGNFVSSFLGSFTNAYSIGSAVVNQNVDSLFDNNLVNAANTFSELGQDWGVVYDTKQMQDNPLLSRKLLTSTISSLGYIGAFVGSAVADAGATALLGPEAGLGLAGVQLTQAFNKLSKFSKIFSNGEDGITALGKTLQTTRNINEAVDQVVKTVPFREGFRKFNQYTQGMFEASIEAKETVASVEEKLKQQYFIENGFNASGEELQALKDKANEAGNWTYFANTALLTATNHFEFGDLFERWRVGKTKFDANQGSLELGLDGYNNIINKGLTREIKPTAEGFIGRAKDYAVKAAKGTPSALTMSTGEFVEEMGQGIISGAGEDYYANFINKPSNGLQSILRATEEQFGTQEGWLSGLSGILTGAAMSGILSAAGVNPMDKTPSNVYAEAVVEELNNNNIGNFLKEKIKADQIKKTNSIENSNRANQKSDYEKQASAHKDTFQYWNTGLKHKQFDLRINQLEEAKNLKGKDFTEEWGMEFTPENEATVNEFINSQIEKGKHIKEVYDVVDRTFVNPFDRRSRMGRSEDNSTSYALYDAAKDELTFQISKFDNNQSYINELLDSAHKSTNFLQTENDIIDLASLYGEEMVGDYKKINGDILREYKIVDKPKTSGRGLSRIKNNFDSEIKDLDSMLSSDLLTSEDRAVYQKNKNVKQNLSERLDKLIENGITEISSNDNVLQITESDDYLYFLYDYIDAKRRDAGINEDLTPQEFGDFYRTIRSLNQATISNERTSLVINDLLSPNAIENFKKEAERINEIRQEIVQEEILKTQEAEKNKTTTSESTSSTLEEEIEPEGNDEEEIDETLETEPEQGDQFEGNVYTKNDEGDDITLKGKFEIVDVDPVDETVTVKQGETITTLPIQDFKESDIEKVTNKSEIPENKTATSIKKPEVNSTLTSDQSEDIAETRVALIEEAITPDEILEVNVSDNTILVEDKDGDQEIFKTLTSALNQKYSDDINPIFKNVAIETSIILHRLFNNSDTLYNDIENIPNISEERFNEINAGFKVYNQWLLDNNKEIVERDFHVKDYNVNDEKGNNALVHIDLLIYDKKDGLYQIVDFKTRSEYSNTKRINGVEGNNPDVWDKQQLNHKAELVRKTLSNKNITNKNFDNSNHIFKFLTNYKNKELTKIKYLDKPKTFVTDNFSNTVKDAQVLKIQGHTLTSLRNLKTKEFFDILKQNKIVFKTLIGNGSNGLVAQWNKVKDRISVDAKTFNSNNFNSPDNAEFWEWQKENYELFPIEEGVQELDVQEFDKRIDSFLKELKEDFYRGDKADIETSFKHSEGIETGIVMEYAWDTDTIQYTAGSNASNITEEQLIEILKDKQYTAQKIGNKKTNYYIPKSELYVKNQFSEKYKIFVNGRKFEDKRTAESIINDYGTSNLKQIVQSISENSKFTPDKELAKNIFSKIPNRFNIQFVDSSTSDNRTPSQYDPVSEKLVINVGMLKELNYSVDNAILHEAIHVLTAQRLRNNTKFIQDINSLLNETKSFVETVEGRTALNNIYGTSNADIYGLSSADEFLAEAMTSPDFQNLLRIIKTENNKETISLWDKFLDNIRKFLGVDINSFKDTLLAKTVNTFAKEFDTLTIDNIGNSFNLNSIFGKTILKIESQDQFEDINKFGNKILRENSIQDILNNTVINRENGVEPEWKKFSGYDYIYHSKFPYNLVLKYPNGQEGMDPFTSLGLVAGFRFKRPNTEEFLTLDQLDNNDISDSEFEQITRVDASLRSEFMSKLNLYNDFQTSLSKINEDVKLNSFDLSVSKNLGTLQLVPYSKRTNVADLIPMMFKDSRGEAAPLILERTYTWELGAGKTRREKSGFSSVFTSPVFENELSEILDFLTENQDFNRNLRSTYVLVIPKGGVQTEKVSNFSIEDFDFIPVYPDNYDISDKSYINSLKLMSEYYSSGSPNEMYDQFIAAEKDSKTVYLSSPENYQFQNIENTMSANSAEISITDGNNNSKLKGYLQYQFRASNDKNNLTVSISPEELANINSTEELIDKINSELEIKIKGTVTDFATDFKLTKDNFKKSLPKTENNSNFIESIMEGKLTTPIHRNIRNVSLNIIPTEVSRLYTEPKESEVLFNDPIMESEITAKEIENNEEANSDKPRKPTQEEIDALHKVTNTRSRTGRSRSLKYGYPSINESLIEDLINVC